MEERIQDLLKEVNAYVVDGKQSLDAFRTKFISRKGAVGELFEEMKKLPAEQKKKCREDPQPIKTSR